MWTAGFEVTGVDINDKHLKNHPKVEGIKHINGDVMEYLNDDFIKDFDFIWASPPCQGFSGLNEANKANFKEGTLERQEGNRNLFFEVQKFLENCGKPYILENVSATKNYMKDPVRICGLDLGLLTFRDRWFQSNINIKGSSCDKEHSHKGYKVISHENLDGNIFSIVGHSGKRNFWNKRVGQIVMGMEWDITALALREAIPPCYAKFLGLQIKDYLKQ